MLSECSCPHKMLTPPYTPSTAQSHEQVLTKFACLQHNAHYAACSQMISASESSVDPLYLMRLLSVVKAFHESSAGRTNVVFATAAGLLLSANVKAPVQQASLPFR